MKGTQVHQFKILEKIGEGGMGEVYEALDTRLERKVALKFLPPAYSKDPEFKGRFEHEARAAAALNHPNIITVHDLGEFEGRTFIAMELITGETLEQRIHRGDLTIQESVRIAAQVSEGLAAAHEAGIIHRDIKPANIFLTKDGRVKILDFGLAKSRRTSTDTKPGTTVGTIQYESPEQSRGSGVDARSDLFSLGVVLYEMITAQRPFKGEFEDAVRYAIAHEQPEPLARYKSDVPGDLQRIVSKLLEKDPEFRYHTAGGLLSDLKLLQRSSGPSAVHAAYTSAPKTKPNAEPASGARSWRRYALPLFGLAMAALLLVFKPWRIEFKPADNVVADADAGPGRLAVMYFDNLADPADAKRQGEVISSLIISDLSEARSLQVVSSQRLYDILKNLGREGTRQVTSDMATEVARKADARWILTGRILESEPQWVVSAELSDVSTGDLLASPTIHGKEGERIFDVVDRLTTEIKQELALPAGSLADVDKPVVQLTTESSDAYRLYLEGKELQYRFQHVEAEAKLRAAIAIDSTFAMAYLRLANTRSSYWNDFPGARELTAQAMKYIDHTTELEACLIRGTWETFNGHDQEAIGYYLKALEINPDEKDARYALGWTYRRLGTPEDLQKAIAAFSHIIESDPRDKNAYNSLAYLYDDVGDLEKSIWAINKYIELAPNEANPYDSKAEILARGGRTAEALAAYRQALRIDPAYLPSLEGAAFLWTEARAYDSAFQIARSTMAQKTPDARARGRSIMARAYLYQGQMKKALDVWAEDAQLTGAGTMIDQVVAQARIERAYVFGILGRSEDADRELSLAVKASARSLSREEAELSVLDDRAAIYAWLHRFAESDSALATLTAHMGEPLATDSITWLVITGENRYQRESYDSAISYFDRAMKRRPSFAPLYLKGKALAGARRFREAVNVLEEAGRTYDNDRRYYIDGAVLVHFWLATVYEKAGRTQDAIREYQTFLEIWKNADPGFKEVTQAKSSLAALTS